MKDYALAALAGFLAGAFLAAALILLFRRKLAQRSVGSVTWFLFVSIALAAISWVFISYALAIYATVHLGQVYTMSELSEPAITGIVAVLFAKVLGNIFEHNDGPLWGKTNRDKQTPSVAAAGGASSPARGEPREENEEQEEI